MEVIDDPFFDVGVIGNSYGIDFTVLDGSDDPQYAELGLGYNAEEEE